jgi:hypothetical protein
MKVIVFYLILYLILFTNSLTIIKNKNESNSFLNKKRKERKESLIKPINDKNLLSLNENLPKNQLGSNPYEDRINFISDDQKLCNESILDIIISIRKKHYNTPNGLQQQASLPNSNKDHLGNNSNLKLDGETIKIAQTFSDKIANDDNLSINDIADKSIIVIENEPLTKEVFNSKLDNIYSQKDKYNFVEHRSINGVESEVSDFIKLVWLNYKSIGVGVSKSKNKENIFYVVILYSPPSNNSQRSINVTKPLRRLIK